MSRPAAREVTGGADSGPVAGVAPAVPHRGPPGRPARGSNCMNDAFMQLKRHERGIHAVSCGPGGPGRGGYETGRAGGTRGSGCTRLSPPPTKLVSHLDREDSM